jgi:hypothetical protein
MNWIFSMRFGEFNVLSLFFRTSLGPTRRVKSDSPGCGCSWRRSSCRRNYVELCKWCTWWGLLYYLLSAHAVGYFCRFSFHVGEEGRWSRSGVQFTCGGVLKLTHWGISVNHRFFRIWCQRTHERISCHLWTVPAHHLKSNSASTFHSNLEEIHTQFVYFVRWV